MIRLINLLPRLPRLIARLIFRIGWVLVGKKLMGQYLRKMKRNTAVLIAPPLAGPPLSF